MPELCVRLDNEAHRIAFAQGLSIREILEPTDLRVRSACRGIGACGLCRVRIISGRVAEPTLSELIHLQPDQLAGGVRLACQVRPEGDLCIELLSPALRSDWKASPEGIFQRRTRARIAYGRELPVDVKRPCGVAVDVGTTNLCLSVFDLTDGSWLADRWGRNPQADFGSDVLTRLLAAAQSPDAAREMSRRVVEAIRDALLDVGSREGIDLRRMVDVRLVGNTAMLALLSGKNYELLLQPEQWMAAVDCTPAPADTSAWAAGWGIHPRAAVEVIAPLAGFVGSDLLAGLVAVRLAGDRAPALFIDFGTNTEIALWDGQVLWVTSAAGGPAFESSGIRHGIPAEAGAVYRVVCDDCEPDRFDYRIIGDNRAKGICGSGLVDLIACLRKCGRLSAMGRFKGGGATFEFVAGGMSMALTKKDIDLLQRAKAALGVGVRALCDKAGLPLADLQRVCVAGVFGHFLDVPNAQAIGLLPRVAPERVELVGNTALAGCSDVLLSAAAAEYLTRLRGAARFVNLAQYSGFEDTFLESLYLKPLEEAGA